MHAKNCESGFGGKFGFGPFWQKQLLASCLSGGNGILGGGHGPLSIISELNLTDDQLMKVAELKIKGMTTGLQTKLAMGDNIRKFAHEITSENLDEEKIRGIAKSLREQKNAVGDSITDHIVELAKILTAEQRKQLRMAAVRKFLGLHHNEQQSA